MTRSVRLPAGTRTDSELHQALNRWQNEVIALEAVDAITTEMVRLRCASHHDCHT
jgi:hypothetical protein